MLKRFLQTPWPLLLWTALIFFLLTIHTGTMESVPMMRLKHIDKVVHAMLFGVLFWLASEYLQGRKIFSNTVFAIVLLTVILLGIGSEFYQEYFTTREFEVKDIIADAAGAVIAAVYVWAKK